MDDSMEQILKKMNESNGNTETVHAGHCFLNYKFNELLLKKQDENQKTLLDSQNKYNKEQFKWTKLLVMGTWALVIVTILMSFAGCSIGKNWVGFYYSDKNIISDKSTWIIQPGLKSLEECQNWVKNIARNNSNFDYECGYDCRYEKNFDETICKETKK